MKLAPINSYLAVMENEENRALHLTLDTGGKTQVAHLYMVSLTRSFPPDPFPVSPVNSIYYVIAESEKGAIAQVMSNAFPSHHGMETYGKDNPDISASAFVVPLHIRGFGRTIF